MITYTTVNMDNYMSAVRMLNELDAQAKYTEISTNDDPRIEAARWCNKAMDALTDHEIDMIEVITGWTI